MDLKGIFGQAVPPPPTATEMQMKRAAAMQQANMIQNQYANKAQGLSNSILSTGTYPTDVTPKYKTLSVRVEEIANGFILDYQGDRYHCPDMKSVGDRVVACMVAAELGE